MRKIIFLIPQKTLIDFLKIIATTLLIIASGCSNYQGWSWSKLRGEPFSDNTMSSTVRKARPASNDSESLGLSAKARQIEANLGVGNADDTPTKSGSKVKSLYDE